MQFFHQLIIKLFNKKVGSDEFGNCYFENSQGRRRFVIYKGIAEASKVPAEWHGWLHHTVDITPVNINTKKYSWQKIHLPNLTGTKNAYNPKTSNQSNKKYQPWQPN